jgi:hypothetical protein
MVKNTNLFTGEYWKLEERKRFKTLFCKLTSDYSSVLGVVVVTIPMVKLIIKNK